MHISFQKGIDFSVAVYICSSVNMQVFKGDILKGLSTVVNNPIKSISAVIISEIFESQLL